MVGGAVGFLLSVRGGDVLEEETWIAVTFPCRRKSVCVGQCVIRGTWVMDLGVGGSDSALLILC